jgi:ADP-heptose:LPS heptosyltransferase
MKVIIFPFAKPMRDNKPHPKNYPWWPELINLLINNGNEIIQVGLEGEEQLVPDFRKNLSITELSDLIKTCDTWIGVDSFGQHLCWDLGVRGLVIFGQSDPKIFGHDENINVLKSRKYLRTKQFWIWEQAEFRKDCFESPDKIFEIFNENFKNNI